MSRVSASRTDSAPADTPPHGDKNRFNQSCDTRHFGENASDAAYRHNVRLKKRAAAVFAFNRNPHTINRPSPTRTSKNGEMKYE